MGDGVTRRGHEDDGRRPSLLDRLSPLIADVLAMIERLRSGAAPEAAIDVHKSLFGRLRAVRDDAVAAGRAETEILDALFPVAAWIDERLAAFPDWRGDTAPLTVTLFKTADAGPAFFERLRRLPDDRRELREVFLVCLALGFTGNVPAERRGDLNRLIAEQRAKLGPLPSPAAMADRPLCPELYQAADPPPPAAAPRRTPWAAVLAGVAALALTVAGTAALLWPEGAPTRPEPAAANGQQDGVIALLLESLDCARVEVSRVDRTVGLTGYVASAVDRERLVRAVEALDDVAAVSSTLEVIEWPFCEMVGLVEAQAAADLAGSPTITPNHADRRYRPGDFLALEVTAAGGFDGYLYVDYLDADGQVLHLLPEPLNPDNIVYAGEVVAVGSDAIRPRPNERQWPVARPFGTKMVVAIATPIPLFDGFRTEQETVSAYLPDLRAALAALRDVLGPEGVAASYLFIEATDEIDTAADPSVRSSDRASPPTE